MPYGLSLALAKGKALRTRVCHSPHRHRAAHTFSTTTGPVACTHARQRYSRRLGDLWRQRRTCRVDVAGFSRGGDIAGFVKRPGERTQLIFEMRTGNFLVSSPSFAAHSLLRYSIGCLAPIPATHPKLPQWTVTLAQEAPTSALSRFHRSLVLLSFVLLLLGGCAQSQPTQTSPTTPISTPTTQASPTTPMSTSTSYHGSVHNTTYDVMSTISLSFTKTGSQIQGTFTVDPPLIGSGPFTGTVSTTTIQFVVSPEDGSATLTFTGTFQSDGSITGTYVTSGSQAGTWQVVPS
jgi:hypothetical protein